MQVQLKQWLMAIGQFPETMIPIAGGAGARRYYRIWNNERSCIVMDASAEAESVNDFIAVDQVFAAQQIRVPKIFARESCYLLLEDFGEQLYANVLTPTNVDTLYGQALQTLAKIQASSLLTTTDFVTHHCQSDLRLFQQWFINTHLAYSLNANEKQQLHELYQLLQDSASAQPQVCIHRDYHSRNLFALTDEVGVIDFQNAMRGPLTYDAISLLRDCYVAFPPARVQQWAIDYYQRVNNTLPSPLSSEQFLFYFDLMGVQRHLKALGTFARKYHRDGEASYLAEMPRTIDYILQSCQQHAMLRKFGNWFEQRVEVICEAP